MYKLFSQRKKEEAGEISDVYSYDEFPNAFRNQFFHIIKDVFSLKEAIKSFYIVEKHVLM